MAISSEQIKRDVIKQLQWDSSVDATNIEVEIRDGTVVLTGKVPTLTARRSAQLDALSIPGVASVDNRLVVNYPPDHVGSDEEIRSAIEKMFLWSPDIDSTRIRVSVENGRVNLGGSADTEWQRVKAEETASSISGVLSVNNCLAVEPSPGSADKGIAEEIWIAINRINANDIDVNINVEKGVVTLTGSVPTWTIYLDVEDTARYTAGVSRVINRITVE